MEFWNDEITDKSWKKLIELNKEFDFILIGGWAVYLYTKLHKSKDIDIIVDYNALRKLSGRYILNKNERLRKYEIKLEEFDIDIYLPKYSRIALPVQDIIKKFVRSKEGFAVPSAEALLILKLGACKDRRDSIKGGKDALDILGLLFYSNIDFKALREIILEYELDGYAELLASILQNFDLSLLNLINLNKKSFSELKNKYLKSIREIRYT